VAFSDIFLRRFCGVVFLSSKKAEKKFRFIFLIHDKNPKVRNGEEIEEINDEEISNEDLANSLVDEIGNSEIVEIATKYLSHKHKKKNSG
jgi:hypothetical protein